jgi:hypothetical protein
MADQPIYTEEDELSRLAKKKESMGNKKKRNLRSPPSY